MHTRHTHMCFKCVHSYLCVWNVCMKYKPTQPFLCPRLLPPPRHRYSVANASQPQSQPESACHRRHCVYVCICMYVCICKYVCMSSSSSSSSLFGRRRFPTPKSARIGLSQASLYVYVCIYVYTYVCMYECMYMNVCACTNANIRTLWTPSQPKSPCYDIHCVRLYVYIHFTICIFIYVYTTHTPCANHV